LTLKVASLNLVGSVFLTSNWFVYIWAVNSGHVIETALGYFINPLVSVVLGALFLHERPRRMQWAAIGAAASGVIYLSVVHGTPPWIALFLAASFGVYGLFKKKAHLRAAEGLALETGLIFVPALVYLVFVEFKGQGQFGHADLRTNALLVFSGVATALPLLFFAAAARRLTLTSLGIVQYLAPSIQFALGVFLYKEPFTLQRFIGFAVIWAGVALYAFELVLYRRKVNRLSKALVQP
jgi:chloramphenicol-sensitive protein RarD